MKLRIALFFTVFFLTSCQFGPELKLPENNYTGNWKSNNEFVNNNILIDRWWEAFGDEQLNELVELAANNNFDIKIALANIEKARAQTSFANSSFLPKIDYNLDASKSYVGSNADGLKESQSYSSGFDAVWEIDLWGGIRKRSKSAKDRYLAQIENKRAMTLSVIAEVVRNYVELRGYQKQLANTRENIVLLEKTIDLIDLQKKVGVATNFDLARVKAQREIVEAQEPNIRANILTAIYRLSVLVGKEPGYLLESLQEDKKIDRNLDIVPVGVPSDILRRRPDIKQAEYLLSASNAEIGAAIADFFPSISLTGSSGVSSSKFSNLFESANKSWSYGGMINLPFFRGGELMAKYKGSKADTKAAMLNYEKTVNLAFEEVESSLIKYAKEIETNKKLALAVKNNEKIVDLANQIYEAGYDDLLSVIDAKRNLISVRNSLVESDTKVLTNLVALFKALGGGFDINENLDKKDEKKDLKDNQNLKNEIESTSKDVKEDEAKAVKKEDENSKNSDQLNEEELKNKAKILPGDKTVIIDQKEAEIRKDLAQEQAKDKIVAKKKPNSSLTKKQKVKEKKSTKKKKTKNN